MAAGPARLASVPQRSPRTVYVGRIALGAYIDRPCGQPFIRSAITPVDRGEDRQTDPGNRDGNRHDLVHQVDALELYSRPRSQLIAE